MRDLTSNGPRGVKRTSARRAGELFAVTNRGLGMDFQQLMGKLGRNGLVIAGGGLLALIVSFFPWYGFTGSVSSEMKALGVQTSVSAWDAGFAAWFPMLLLFALGVVAVL